MTSSTGIAAIKITSLLRPELLLKVSSLIECLKNPALANEKSDVLAWKSLLALSEDSFEAHFSSIASQHGISFSQKELGELRNMLLRLDEIGEVLIFYIIFY